MKIICDCGCEINQPITAKINSAVPIQCLNCKKFIEILVVDNEGLKHLKQMENNNEKKE